MLELVQSDWYTAYMQHMHVGCDMG